MIVGVWAQVAPLLCRDIISALASGCMVVVLLATLVYGSCVATFLVGVAAMLSWCSGCCKASIYCFAFCVWLQGHVGGWVAATLPSCSPVLAAAMLPLLLAGQPQCCAGVLGDLQICNGNYELDGLVWRVALFCACMALVVVSCLRVIDRPSISLLALALPSLCCHVCLAADAEQSWCA